MDQPRLSCISSSHTSLVHYVIPSLSASLMEVQCHAPAWFVSPTLPNIYVCDTCLHASQCVHVWCTCVHACAYLPMHAHECVCKWVAGEHLLWSCLGSGKSLVNLFVHLTDGVDSWPHSPPQVSPRCSSAQQDLLLVLSSSAYLFMESCEPQRLFCFLAWA